MIKNQKSRAAQPYFHTQCKKTTIDYDGGFLFLFLL
jgi:hypothetical protein